MVTNFGWHQKSLANLLGLIIRSLRCKFSTIRELIGNRGRRPAKKNYTQESKKNYTQEWVASLLAGPEWVRHQEYLMESDASLQSLRLVRDLGSIPPDVIPLITIVHNELPRLSEFFRHYRALGIGRFIVVDHRSNDGTSEFLRRQPDVQLYRAEKNYDRAVSGGMWVTGLARRFVMGRWALHVDADELLVYDGMERHSLCALASLLESRGETRLYAPMLDMYARGPIAESIVVPGKRLIDIAPFFDPLHDGNFAFYERLHSPYGPTIMGYNRSRVFGNLTIAPDNDKPLGFHMEKFPLSKWSERTAYCCVHYPFPFNENPSTPLGILLHFRFVGKFVEFNKSVAGLGEVWDGGSSYRAYADKVEQNHGLSLYHASSRQYEGPESLISEGFLHSIYWTNCSSSEILKQEAS